MTAPVFTIKRKGYLTRASALNTRGMTAVSGLIWEVASQGEMWWDFKQPAQQDLFASWVELGEKFYEAIIARPVPLDMRTLQALKSSSSP